MKVAFVRNSNRSHSPTALDLPKSTASVASELMFECLKNGDEDNHNYDVNEELQISEKKSALEQEVSKYKLILQSDEFKNNKFSSKQFWINQSNKLPNLANLALILLNIQCSSSCIERFFSICGVVCKKHSSNQNDDLVITRCLLKSNIKLLDELNQYSAN